MHRHAAVSLADLAAAGLRLRPTDAVTIVRELALQVSRGVLPGVPSAHVIRLSPSGSITVEGPVVASGHPVPRAAQLLASLLPKSGRSSAQASLLAQLIAQTRDDGTSGTSTMSAFAEALAPFAANDSQAAVKALTERWAYAVRAAEPDDDDGEEEARSEAGARKAIVTVSDMRRARRDTGLSLQEVSRKSRIPVSLLRQLEWGYLRNWPTGLYGRTELVRYARAAGLDQESVLAAMWPMIEVTAARSRPAAGAAPGEPVEASTDAITIVHSSFEDDEVLFEAEHDAEPAQDPPVTVGPVVSAPHATVAPVAPALHAASASRDEELADRPIARMPALPAGVLDGAANSDGPRRSSMVAAAALLALVTAGAVWGIRSERADDRVTATSARVRQVPLRNYAAVPPPAAGLHATPPRSLAVPPRVSAARNVGTGGTPVTAPVLRQVDATDDETFGYSPAFASAGGAAFASPVQPAVGESENDPGGLGLRITRVVDDHATNYHTRPSPDGTRVAFDSDRDGERGVFVADANGRNLHRVSGDGFAAVPNWSPDGRLLSYARAEADNPDVWNLWMLDLVSGETRRLTSNSSGRPWGASWFPDGQRLAYARDTSIVVLDVVSGRTTEYQSPQARRAPRAPAVSPDGRWVIFQIAGDGAWLLDLTDHSFLRVLSDPTAEDFTWSPDGSRVAYYSRHDGEWSVWVMAAR